jgi:hypothetical protein
MLRLNHGKSVPQILSGGVQNMEELLRRQTQPIAEDYRNVHPNQIKAKIIIPKKQ